MKTLIVVGVVAVIALILVNTGLYVVDETEPVPLVRRQFPQDDVQVLEAERVPVVVVEKHRVEELSGDLEGRWITVDQWPVGLLNTSAVAGRDGEHASCAQM